MKLYCVSQVTSARGARVWGVALALGLAAGCGDDEGATSPVDNGDAAVTITSEATAIDTSGEVPIDTTGAVQPVTSETVSPVDAGGGNGGGSGDGGSSWCGGAGEPCCEEAVCGGGLACVVEAFNVDAGMVNVDDGGFGGVRRLLAPLGDGGWFAVDAGLTSLALDAGVVLVPDVIGVCQPCGGEGERCCADDACNDGFACEAERPGPNATRACVAQAPVSSDGGGFEVPDASEAGAGGADASAECGGLDQACCEGRGNRGGCDDGLVCDSRAPRGLEGDVCIER